MKVPMLLECTVRIVVGLRLIPAFFLEHIFCELLFAKLWWIFCGLTGGNDGWNLTLMPKTIARQKQAAAILNPRVVGVKVWSRESYTTLHFLVIEAAAVLSESTSVV